MTTIQLDHPVDADGRTITSLAMRRPKVRDERDARRIAGADESEREIVLFANLCEVAPDTIHELDLSDYVKLQRAFTDFFPAGGPAQTTSAERPRK